jgi:hypothetical protein
MQELVSRIQGALTEPWNKKTGRPKSFGLYHAVELACMYLRQNGTQEFLGDLRNTSQSTMSRIVTTLVPMVKAVLEEFVPTAQEAIELVNGRVCLVDGTITPCWSYADHNELWSRKHGTTGFNAQLVCLLDGAAIYVPIPSRARLMMPPRSPVHRLLRLFGTLAAGSVTKGTKDAAWSPHGRHLPAGSSA